MAVRKRKRPAAVSKSAAERKTGKEFQKAQKKFVKAKTAEGSAFGSKDTSVAAIKKRVAARKQARQAGGSGRIGLGGVKKLKPRKLKKK